MSDCISWVESSDTLLFWLCRPCIFISNADFFIIVCTLLIFHIRTLFVMQRKSKVCQKKLEEFTFCRMSEISEKTLNPRPSAFLRTLQLFLCKIQNSLFYFYPQRSASWPLLQYQHLLRQYFLSFKPKVHSLRSLKKYVRVLMAEIKKQFNTVKGIRNTMGCTNP